jgi:nickel-dependent lactate racemase
VPIVNHLWKDAATFVDLGATENGTPVRVSRLAHEAGFLIGTGSIVPHIFAGWAGGAKIVQPGICAAETTARTHYMAAETGRLLGIAGRIENPVRREIERVAEMVGLDFILNCVIDANGGPAWVGAGDPLETHRGGVAVGELIYLQEIPGLADVVVADARPTVKDYWQGVKALSHAQRGVRDGGTVVLVADFPEGIAPTHPEFARHALRSPEELMSACGADEIPDHIACAALVAHALIRARCSVVCVSTGMSAPDRERLGFRHAESVSQALEAALAEHGEDASVGVVEMAGDVLPVLPEG